MGPCVYFTKGYCSPGSAAVASEESEILDLTAEGVSVYVWLFSLTRDPFSISDSVAGIVSGLLDRGIQSENHFHMGVHSTVGSAVIPRSLGIDNAPVLTLGRDGVGFQRRKDRALRGYGSVLRR